MLTPIKAIRAKCLDCCGGQANADERIYCSQIKDILKRELKSLSEDQQQAIQLIFYEGLKQTDAAAIMGVGRSVVSRLEQTAIFALRRQLRGLIQ